MVAVPILGNMYATPLQREITHLTEPARTELTHLQLGLALEGAVLDDYLETRDTLLLSRLEGVHTQEVSAYKGLAALVSRLGPEVRRRFDELRDLDESRHARARRLMESPRVRTAGGDRLHKNLYESVMVAAAQLDETLNDATQARRERVVAAERVERWLTIGLGALALAAIAVVIRLGQRLQLAARQAEQRREALAAALVAREKLMRGVSHDLKNPLNAIDGHAALIEDGVKGPLTAEQKESIGRIRRAVQTQLSLIVDLLELSRAEAGSLAIHKELTDLCAVVAEEVEEQRPAAEAAGQSLTFAAAETPPLVETDAERVKQVVGNLLSNAVKYTPPRGSIQVEVEALEGAGRLAGKPAVAIRVSDTGTGIPPEKTAAIFEEFTRLSPGMAEGAGLGLAIARRISRLLGGDITVVSEVGTGSVFSFWLPYKTDGRKKPSGTMPDGR
jgi:signal transduction histidine kinase